MLNWVEHENSFITSGPDLMTDLGWGVSCGCLIFSCILHILFSGILTGSALQFLTYETEFVLFLAVVENSVLPMDVKSQWRQNDKF